MANDSTHLDQAALIQLLWLAAPCHGTSESLLHLVANCSGCYKPRDLPVEHDFGDRHFTEQSLESLAERIASSGSEDALAQLQHLLSACDACARLGRKTRLASRHQASGDWSADRLQSLASNVSKKMDAWMERVPVEKQEAQGLAQQLLDQPQARRLMMIRNSRRFKTWPLIDLLCEESNRASKVDPREGVLIAEIAVEIAENVEPESYGPAIRADIGARAWAYLGHAHRLAEKPDLAEIAFSRSEELLGEGTLLEGARAEVLFLRSYLEMHRGRTAKACQLVQEAREIYRALGDVHMQGHMYLIEAHFASRDGSPEEAVAFLKVATQLTDPEREPRLTSVARQNLVVSLADLERFEEAEALLPGAWELCRSIGSRLDQLRLRWTEARIDYGLGRLHRAEITLTEVKEAFKSLDLPYDAALAGLELALLYSQQGRNREIKLLALEMLPVFARNENHRDALAAMTLFAKAAAVEEATREIVEKALGSLREAALRQ